jgi:hypothetical protein
LNKKPVRSEDDIKMCLNEIEGVVRVGFIWLGAWGKVEASCKTGIELNSIKCREFLD